MGTFNFNSELDNISCHKQVVYPELKINNIIKSVVNFNFLIILINGKSTCHIVSRKVPIGIGIINVVKNTIRIVTTRNYIAQSEPIFKNLNLFKIDLYKLNIFKFHFNLIRGTPPSKFDIFCPKQSLGSNYYKIRNSK